MVLKLLLAVICILGVNTHPHGEFRDDIDDEMKLDTPGLLKKHGYPVEIHTVQTDDGYILTMHRVPYSPVSPLGQRKKHPILVQHGLLSSSADWVVMGPGVGYAYILADAGFDVWLGNYRGNVYSKNHTTLDVASPAFWNFSWHEQGIHDLPKEIDYITNETGEEKIFYAGHSMGTTTFYVMCSERPEYNDKIRAMFSLSPVAFMNHMDSPLKLIAFWNKPIEDLLEMIGLYEFMPNDEIFAILGKELCRQGNPLQGICSNILFLIAGWKSNELNTTMLPSIIAHTPAGASTKQILHYSQLIASFYGYFRQYDYGEEGNMKMYGSETPPNYDLKKVTAPVFLHFSRNDWLSSPTDVSKLCKALGNPIRMYELSHKHYNHLDYLWAINGKTKLYDKTISFMNGVLNGNINTNPSQNSPCY